jgi:hypothetical protein
MSGMTRTARVALALLSASVAIAVVEAAHRKDETSQVQVVEKPAAHRVDVLVDGKPFTSYLYPPTLEKPVLFPLRTAAGVIVTRGFPLEPRPGERDDHPHHVGHWFNFGDVNGFDFWGHSSATPAAQKPKMGVIVHKAITAVRSGPGRGELAVRADWVIPDGAVLLEEETRFVFSAGPDRRAIDRHTTWRATGRAVTFHDTKEGAFGIRVARDLEHPSGQYLGSDGKTGEAVWGTRGPWMALSGAIDGKAVTVAILDHPASHGYPTYWHARGYGLFAANPFGRHAFDAKQPEAAFTLQPGKSVTFHHRILLKDGTLAATDLEKEGRQFSAERPGQAPK